MSVDGVWTGEIYGPYGWENSGVYALENGRIVGGNNRHYSSGTYDVSGNTYKAEVFVHYYGPPRVIFGEPRAHFEIDEAGEFGVICNEFCGIGHHTMVGRIHVVE